MRKQYHAEGRRFDPGRETSQLCTLVLHFKRWGNKKTYKLTRAQDHIIAGYSQSIYRPGPHSSSTSRFRSSRASTKQKTKNKKKMRRGGKINYASKGTQSDITIHRYIHLFRLCAFARHCGSAFLIWLLNNC